MTSKYDPAPRFELAFLNTLADLPALVSLMFLPIFFGHQNRKVGGLPLWWPLVLTRTGVTIMHPRATATETPATALLECNRVVAEVSGLIVAYETARLREQDGELRSILLQAPVLLDSLWRVICSAHLLAAAGEGRSTVSPPELSQEFKVAFLDLAQPTTEG